ncbi:MAG: hypothetical protein ACLPZJ_11305 [Terriglobales bacterium]
MDPMNVNEEREVDRWLESALSQYGKAEPRTGLESRVLASLQAERKRIASQGRWWWAAGTVTALAVILVAAWIGESDRERKPVNTAGTSTTPTEEFRGSIQPVPALRMAHPANGYPASPVAKRGVVIHPLRDLAASSAPKLEQFPSPRNLSKKESLLVRRLNEQTQKEALLETTATRAEVDLSIDSLEIRPLQIPDIEISESNTN